MRRGEERCEKGGGRGIRKGKEERRGEKREKGGREHSKWKGHLKEGAVLHGTNNQRDVSCERLDLVEAGDHLHLDI